VESAGIGLKGRVQAQAAGITAPGVDWVVANKAQTHCPRLERLVPWIFQGWKSRRLQKNIDKILSAVRLQYAGLEKE
jgi:hypothetical protein